MAADRDLFGRAWPPRPRPAQLSLALGFGALRLDDPDLIRAWSGEPASNSTGPIAAKFRLDPGAEGDLGRRWAEALKGRLAPDARAKRLARLLGAEIRTAEGWLAGQAPQLRYLFRAFRVFGPTLLAEVLAPGSAWSGGVDLDQRAQEIERRLRDLARDLARIRQGGGRP